MTSDSRLFSRVLLTNDDGFHAPGMRSMRKIAAALAEEVWIVAPAGDQSGTSQSVTLHDPLRIQRYGEREYAVTGTPADCVIVGIEHVMAGARPELVLSGVNRGANLADAVNYSGTVGAALTAKVMGYSAVALSQAFKSDDTLYWETCEQHAVPIIERLQASGQLQQAGCFNINFPALPAAQVGEAVFTRQGGGSMREVSVEERIDTRGNAYQWISFRHNYGAEQRPLTDIDVLRNAGVSVMPLGLERHAIAPELEFSAL